MWTNEGTLIRLPRQPARPSSPLVGDGPRGPWVIKERAMYPGDLEPRSLWPWGRGGPWTGSPILPWAPLRASTLSPRGLVLESQELTGSGRAPVGSGDHPQCVPGLYLAWPPMVGPTWGTAG